MTSSPDADAASDPFLFTSGPRDAKIMLVGEAWGAEEAVHRTPFVGQSGRELFRMLGQALKIEPELLTSALSQRSVFDWLRVRSLWLTKASILLCNVVSMRPPDNDFTHLLFDSKTAKKDRLDDYFGIYPKPELWAGIHSLWRLVRLVSPQLIIAAGNWPLHILTPHSTPKTSKGYKLPTGIASWRGSQTYTRSVDSKNLPLTPIPCLPLIHPAAILRDWSLRHVTVHDLRSRASRYINGHIKWEAPPSNDIWSPTFLQATQLLDSWLSRCRNSTLWLAVDLETYKKRFITCLGLADSDLSLCIPFFYFNSSQQAISYWFLSEEQELWSKLKLLLEHPNCKIIGQNFIYDTQYLKRHYDVDAIVSGETMVAHHLLFPGTPKGLAMLASLYNNHFCYWKDESEEWAIDEASAKLLWQYNCKDTRATYEAWTVLSQLIAARNIEHLYAQRLRAWRLSRKLALRGVLYDNTLRSRYLSDLAEATGELEIYLLDIMPEELRYSASGKPWFSSPQSIMHIFYHVLGMKPVLHKKTKRATSDNIAINELADRPENEWLDPIFSGLKTLRSALVSSRNFLSVDLTLDRLCSQFNISHPETFRWSSAANAFGEGGNLQNLPRIED